MNVHQMSATYVAEHDRILLRVNTTQGAEMHLWLTRRLMLGLWPALNDAVSRHGPVAPSASQLPDDRAEALKAAFAHQAQWQKNDFSQPYAAPAEPLPADVAPLLVGEVELTATRADGDLRVHFRELPAEGRSQRGFQLTLAPQLGHGLVHLLERALEQAQWRLGEVPSTLARSAGAGTGTGTEASLGEADFAPDFERPRYLN